MTELLLRLLRAERVIGLLDDDVGVEALGEQLQLGDGDRGVGGTRGRRGRAECVARRREQGI